MSQLLRETAVPDGDTALLDPPVTDSDSDGLDVAVLPRPRLPQEDVKQSDAQETREQGDDHEDPWRRDDDLRAECINIAIQLSALSHIGDRIEIYKWAGISKLSRAAALRPELMPYLNDELEWITLTSADFER
jgi:hypothetical protein